MHLGQILPRNKQPTIGLGPSLQSLHKHHVVFTVPLIDWSIVSVEDKTSDSGSSFEIDGGVQGSDGGGVGHRGAEGSD